MSESVRNGGGRTGVNWTDAPAFHAVQNGGHRVTGQSGFRFEHDQWISAAATAWATMALAAQVEYERTLARGASR